MARNKLPQSQLAYMSTDASHILTSGYVQEAYLSKRLQTAARGSTADDTCHSHFKLRQAPSLHQNMVNSFLLCQ